MSSNWTWMRFVGSLLISLVLAACSSPRQTYETPVVYSNPFAYCAAVGTIDAPDARYTGEKMPVAIAQGLKQAFGAPESAPLEPFLKNSYWRCMNGKVYACTVGANLPCMTKADLSRTPTQPMEAFCQQSPAADVIPAVVTGRATVYLWRCVDGKPEIVRQVSTPDARGFLSNIWYEIQPG